MISALIAAALVFAHDSPVALGRSFPVLGTPLLQHIALTLLARNNHWMGPVSYPLQWSSLVMSCLTFCASVCVCLGFVCVVGVAFGAHSYDRHVHRQYISRQPAFNNKGPLTRLSLSTPQPTPPLLSSRGGAVPALSLPSARAAAPPPPPPLAPLTIPSATGANSQPASLSPPRLPSVSASLPAPSSPPPDKLLAYLLDHGETT